MSQQGDPTDRPGRTTLYRSQPVLWLPRLHSSLSQRRHQAEQPRALHSPGVSRAPLLHAGLLRLLVTCTFFAILRRVRLPSACLSSTADASCERNSNCTIPTTRRRQLVQIEPLSGEVRQRSSLGDMQYCQLFAMPRRFAFCGKRRYNELVTDAGSAVTLLVCGPQKLIMGRVRLHGGETDQPDRSYGRRGSSAT